GAVCGSAARTDLAGGRWATIVPTGTDLSVTAISHAAGLFDFKPCSATNDVNRPRPNSEMSISTHFEGQKDRA
ncbi:hypothetical protein ACC778_36540, partial [Rhizobium ruizarguesonis]